MNKILNISLIFTVCYFTGCESTNNSTWQDVRAEQLGKCEYDVKLGSSTLEMFRLQISPNVAKSIAEQQGYRIQLAMSSITFDDLEIMQRRNGLAEGNIWLNKPAGELGELDQLICLEFKNSKLESIEVTYSGVLVESALQEQFSHTLKNFDFLTEVPDKYGAVTYEYVPNEYARMWLRYSKGKKLRIILMDANYSMKEYWMNYRP